MIESIYDVIIGISAQYDRHASDSNTERLTAIQ